jgi:uncharacterized protein YmfQ (DUF2313 family)
MAAPLYSAADYQAALQALLPRGRAWPRESDAVQTKLALGLAQSYARSNGRANDLVVDAFPATTFQLLPEWEATLGLPDPCAGPSPTIQGRRGQVVARFTGVGGQTPAYMIAFAKNLGYTITIKQYMPARVGQSRVGQPLCGPAWAHAWSVSSALNTVVRSRVGTAAAGEPLASWGNAVLECELRAIAPAHTVLFFTYS